MITQKTINDVFNTAKVEEVVGDFINLKRRGVNLIGHCPFHDEKTPSFTVSPSKNIYKCFGCGKGGDPVRFIIDHEKLSFPEAIKFLAAKYRIEIEETANSDEEIQLKQITDSLFIINEYARDYYSDVLFHRSEGKSIGLSYFKERGFRESTIQKFQLGYATEEKDAFTKKAIEKKFNPDLLRTLGLITKSDADFFRARVIFPIHNLSGKVVAFAGRTLSKDKNQPKYINSPESEIYNKRSVLYGLYFAKDHIRKEDACILVEGYTDVITLHQGNIKNVVASSGTSLTKEQIKLIKRYTQNIKIIYDGDPAGIKAALRGLDLVLESDMNVKLVLLPESHDPDSFLAASGTESFLSFLNENEEDFVFFKTRILLKETNNDPIKKTIVIRDIVGSIAKIPDNFKRALYIKQCSTMLELSEAMLHEEVNKAVKADLKAKHKMLQQQGDSSISDQEYDMLYPKRKFTEESPALVMNDAWQEKAICNILVNYGHLWYNDTEKVTIADFIIHYTMQFLKHFDVEIYKKILKSVADLKTSGEEISHLWFTTHSDEDIRTFAINALSSPYVYASWEKREMFLQSQKMPDENYINDAENAVQRLLLKKMKKEIDGLLVYFHNASPEDVNSDEYDLNIRVLQQVQSQRNELAAKLGTVIY